MAPTLAFGAIALQVQQTEPQVQQIETTPNDTAPMPAPPAPVTSPSTPGCTPTTSLLRFDGGYEVSMCYVTPDGESGEAKAGLYASAESGLLWFFSRENAEVLVKVLNGCAINGHRWVFVAPVTTLEFDLQVTSPTGARWNHTNTQGVTAATKSDVAAFACADEPEAVQDHMAPPALPTLPTLAVEPQFETTPELSDSDTSAFVPATSPDDSGCTPTTGLLHFDGGYEVSMCYRTPDTPDGTEGVAGQAKAGLYASAESGLLWFFSRDNAEVLVKVLNGCAINGYRWVFTAPVTTLEFDLWVTSPTGVRWTHGNTQGVTAATKSDVAAFACADEPEAAPDLIVSSVSVSDANPVAGQNIAFRATVRNRGDDASSPTTIRYYQSSDSTISASDDDSLASEAVPALAASTTESRTFDFTVPSTPGTLYLGACVDPFSAEFNTGNNCSTGVRVVVEEEPETAPDLVVSGVTVSDASPVVGQNIALRATVRNRGDGPATPTTLRFYRSSDSTISTADDFVSSVAVPALSTSATMARTLNFRVPSTPGTFYLGACVNSVSAESNTGNNCSTGVRVVVEEEPEEPEVAPDLIVSSTVSDATPAPQQTITLRATVRNRGDGPAPPATLRYYRSSDSAIGTADLFLASAPVPTLAASATESTTFDFTAPSTPGTFYLGACIDSVSGESNTGNNCSTGVVVTVAEPGPDLIASSVSVSDATPAPEQNFLLHAAVRNGGDGPASTTTLRYYRSSDSTISTSDVLLTGDLVSALAASAAESRTFFGTAPSTPGTYYLGFCIDSVSAESDTANNCSDAVPVTVEEPASLPDLVVPRVLISDWNPDYEDEITMRGTVLNRGDGPASATTLHHYSSLDSTISTSDFVWSASGDPVDGLAAGATTASAPDSWTTSDGPFTRYHGFCIVPVADESDTDNNCSAGVRVDANTEYDEVPETDLILFSASVSDASPGPGEAFLLHAEVRNRGGGDAASTMLHYYRSDDPTISTSDVLLASDPVSALAVSAAESRTFYGTAPSAPGTYYFGACIDAVSAETNTDNNCSDGALLTVEPKPDLVLSSVAVNDDNPAPEHTIEFTATVRNRGVDAALPTTIRYHWSNDWTISTSDFQLGADAVAAFPALTTESRAFDFTAPSAPGTYYLGACLDAVSRESDTGNNCSAGVRVVVDPGEGPVVAPDLIIPNVSVSDANPVAQQVIQFMATVQNDGDGSALPTTIHYYRSDDDSTISASDNFISSDTVSALSASATESRTLDFTAPTFRGTYYLGACIDPVPGESDMSNNCSAGERVVID